MYQSVDRLPEKLEILSFHSQLENFLSEADENQAVVMEGIGLLRSRMFKVLLAYIVDLANVLTNTSRKTKGFQLSSLSQVFKKEAY